MEQELGSSSDGVYRLWENIKKVALSTAEEETERSNKSPWKSCSSESLSDHLRSTGCGLLASRGTIFDDPRAVPCVHLYASAEDSDHKR